MTKHTPKAKQRKKELLIVAAAIAAVILLAAAAIFLSKPVTIRFEQNLDQTALTIDGQEYPLRSMAFYIAYEENLVERQAEIYSPGDTRQYWNLKTNGEYLSLAARKAAMDMAIHDLVFYAAAMESGLVLTADDMEQLAMKQQDFWYDLTDYQQEVLDGLQEEVFTAMERKALAEQMQAACAATAGCTLEDFDCNGSKYQPFLDGHTYEIQESIWNRLDFGNITLAHH